MFRIVNDLREEMSSLRRSVQILENNSGSYTNNWNASTVDLNMNSGIDVLTTTQIVSLIGVDPFPVESISMSDITIDLNDFDDYTGNNKIKF